MTQIDELVKRAREPWTPTEGKREILCGLLADALEAQAARVKELETILDANDQLIDGYVARIASLEAQLEAFRKALEPLARMDAQTNQPDDSEAYAFDNWAADRAVFTIGKDRIITVGDIRRARALMSALAASQRRDGPEVLALRNAEGEKDGE